MIDLTLVMSVYGQPLMLMHQAKSISEYPHKLLDHLHVVVVDDCGTPAVDVGVPEFLVGFVKSVKLFRVTEDIPWNQHGCRNLAVEHSSGWCLFMDPDFVFSGEMIERLMQVASKMQRGQVLKYALRHVNSGKIDMSSPNTWLIHRDDFFAVGGCDEDFSGAKGWQDVQLLDILKSCYKIQARPDLWADFHGTDSIPDAMVTKLDRSTKANRKKRVKKVEQARKAGGWKRWAKTRVDVPRLRFKWTQLFPIA